VPLLALGEAATVDAFPEHGLLATEEFCFPIHPRRALLFTWANEPDTRDTVDGTHDMAANMNRAVIGQADREWFHHPERRATRLGIDGLPSFECRPLGRLLLPDYGTEAAIKSQRRFDATKCINEMIEHRAKGKMRVARVTLQD